MAEPGRQELVLSDFEKYLPPDKAMQAFLSFEVTVHGTVTKESVIKWVVDVYNERKSLSLTLNDNRTVIYNVNRLLDLVISTFTWISLKDHIPLKYRCPTDCYVRSRHVYLSYLVECFGIPTFNSEYETSSIYSLNFMGNSIPT